MKVVSKILAAAVIVGLVSPTQSSAQHNNKVRRVPIPRMQQNQTQLSGGTTVSNFQSVPDFQPGSLGHPGFSGTGFQSGGMFGAARGPIDRSGSFYGSLYQYCNRMISLFQRERRLAKELMRMGNVPAAYNQILGAYQRLSAMQEYQQYQMSSVSVYFVASALEINRSLSPQIRSYPNRMAAITHFLIQWSQAVEDFAVRFDQEQVLPWYASMQHPEYECFGPRCHSQPVVNAGFNVESVRVQLIRGLLVGAVGSSTEYSGGILHPAGDTSMLLKIYTLALKMARRVLIPNAVFATHYACIDLEMQSLQTTLADWTTALARDPREINHPLTVRFASNWMQYIASVITPAGCGGYDYRPYADQFGREDAEYRSSIEQNNVANEAELDGEAATKVEVNINGDGNNVDVKQKAGVKQNVNQKGQAGSKRSR
jgi:hypothetical protein